VAIPKLGTTLPPAVPNWLQSPLKPRAQLYMEVASSRDDHRPRVDLWWDKRLSKVQGGRCSEVESSSNIRLANSKAGIKPTASLSAFDKENSIEFPLDFLHYLYNYYMVCALFSHTYHVTHHVTSCDVMLWLPVMWLWLCNTCDVTLSHTFFCVVSLR